MKQFPPICVTETAANDLEKTVQTDHDAYYNDPIQLKAGEVFTLSGRRDAWEDNPDHVWLWAIALDGREGWVPEGFVAAGQGEAIAPRDYFARELNARAGETLQILQTTNGWAWCKNSSGKTGWVPLSVFERIVQ